MTSFWRYGWIPLLLLGLIGLRPLPASRPRPLQTAYWYWHHPFQLTSQEVHSLRTTGVERLYVHVGSVVRRGPDLRLEQRQRWARRSPVPLFAVLRVHPGANEALLAPGGDATCVRLFESAHLPPGLLGIQLDADVPSSRLAPYAAFLRRLRRRLPRGWKLSITALPDWIERPEWSALRSGVDEIVPQFYGNRLPANDSVPPLWETSRMLRRVQEATRGEGAAVWVGLPRYGRCVVLGPAGRPAGVRHDLDLEALLDDPGWRVSGAEVRRDSRAGLPLEERLTLCAETEASAGPFEAPPDTTLWFQWPREEGLEAAVAGLRRQPGGVAGVCYFRLPAPDEPLGMPLPTTHAFSAATPAMLFVRLVRRAGRILVVVKNQGEAAPLVDPGITVEVSPAGGQVLASGPVRWLREGEPTAPLRADGAVLSRPLLWPGHTWSACEIRDPRGAVRVQVRWREGRGEDRSNDAELPLLAERTGEGERP